MPYTEQSLKAALAGLPIQPARWVYDAKPHTLTGQNVGTKVAMFEGFSGPQQQFRYELWRYCWAIYHLTNTDSGEQVVGREWDTDAFSPSTGHQKWKRVNERWVEVAQKTGVNLDPAARGNALKIDKWHPVLNDCWLLGGVHRLAPFRLVSMAHAGNVWNFAGGRMVVTARELLGLRHFGYRPDERRSAADIVYRPAEPQKASAATLQSYAAMLASPAATRQTMLREMVDPGVKDLMGEIRGFDRSRLR